jgi:hypothetical protein
LHEFKYFIIKDKNSDWLKFSSYVADLQNMINDKYCQLNNMEYELVPCDDVIINVSSTKLRELFKKDCPQVKDGPETINPIDGTGRYYNVVVQYANTAEILAENIEKMNNIKKDPANQAFVVKAISPGEWGNGYQVSINYVASLDEITFHVFEERGSELIEVENGVSVSSKADQLVFKNVMVGIANPIDPTNPQTIPVNDVDPDTGTELPMPLMGGADMFTSADYMNDEKIAPYIAGSVVHSTGVWAVQNFEEFAFKALACPYFSQYGMVSGEMVSLAENRRDFHVVVDTPDITPSAVVNWRTSGNHNSKFESIYYPWLMKLDTYTKKVVPVPASGSALQAMALSMKNGKICDAPAGTTRGMIFDAVAISKDIKLSQVTRDRLYAMGINPIIKGLTTGICIMGQKTTFGAIKNAPDRFNLDKFFDIIETISTDYHLAFFHVLFLDLIRKKGDIESIFDFSIPDQELEVIALDAAVIEGHNLTGTFACGEFDEVSCNPKNYATLDKIAVDTDNIIH